MAGNDNRPQNSGAPKAPEPVRVRVVALERGTYPSPGAIIADLREPGEVFTVSDRRHLSAWMRELKDDEAVPQAIVEPPKIPQTTTPRKGEPLV